MSFHKVLSSTGVLTFLTGFLGLASVASSPHIPPVYAQGGALMTPDDFKQWIPVLSTLMVAVFGGLGTVWVQLQNGKEARLKDSVKAQLQAMMQDQADARARDDIRYAALNVKIDRLHDADVKIEATLIALGTSHNKLVQKIKLADAVKEASQISDHKIASAMATIHAAQAVTPKEVQP